MVALPTLLPGLLDLVTQHAPGGPSAIDAARLRPELALVDDLGYDSVRLVELLLACGDRFGVELPIEALLDGPPLTLGAVADALTAAAAAAATAATAGKMPRP
jgi:acyl carrier protein